MTRTIEYGTEQVVLHLKGLLSVGALKREVSIPYKQIKRIALEDFKVSMLQFRVGTSIADIRQGRFLIDGRWCFVSYEDHQDVVVIELEGHDFAKVVFQIDDPEDVIARIEAHLG
ncbi:hypothetical protein [Paenibacillus methanolicus]|uniref:PH (Pleckstrin Homology) domain-containing protein n=1 Tax=Paenibacillus methanolicus TaxID=582686 RepID=A0A5S5CM41_9BACL|nr:hypothetical protein [Paenibacillus methanolicus]TYP79458.1 hypothetical protein BCM02_101576 [Paenibacillus methanolicus]